MTTARAHTTQPSTRHRYASSSFVCTVSRALTPRAPRWLSPRSYPLPWAASLRPARWPPLPPLLWPLMTATRLMGGSLVAGRRHYELGDAHDRVSFATCARRQLTSAADGRRARRGRAARMGRARARADMCAPRRHMDHALCRIYILYVYVCVRHSRTVALDACPSPRGGGDHASKAAPRLIYYPNHQHPRPHNPPHQGKVSPPCPSWLVGPGSKGRGSHYPPRKAPR